MQTRRQFLSRAGARGRRRPPRAAGVARPAAKRASCCAAGGSPQGVLSGDPTPHGITLATRVDDVEGSGGVRLEVARDKRFRNVVARKTIAHEREPQPRGQGARERPARPHEDYFYRFETRTSTAGRALPDRAARPTRASPCASRSSPARTTRTATTTPTRRWRARTTSTSSSASATTSTPRSSTRARAAPACATTDGARATADARGRHARRLPRQVRAVPLRRGAAQAARAASRWSRSGTTTRSDNYAGSLAGRRAAAPTRTTPSRAATPRYKAFFEAMPFVRPARARDLPRRCASASTRRADHARPAPVPRRPAVRRRGRPRLRRAARAARRSSARTQMDWAKSAPERVEGRLEGDRPTR